VIAILAEFVDELRAAGIPVSMVEAIDAGRAVEFTDFSDRENVRAALGATLVKNARHYDAFDRAFDVYFGVAPLGARDEVEPGQGHAADGSGSEIGGGSGLLDSLVDALVDGSRDGLRTVIANAIDHYAGMVPGRPVGGRYYAYRVLQRIDTDALLARLLAALNSANPVEGIDLRFQREQAEALIQEFRKQLEVEITGRLVAERGPNLVAATRRLPLAEDIDLMHATQAEIEKVEHALRPLARKLATRLGQQRRRDARGRLDVRRTIRRSLGHGGTMLEPQFKDPRVSKPEIVVLCDVSGSMATFARFTMQLTYAISAELAKVRIFAFIDGLDEVTEYFTAYIDFADSLVSMSRRADIVRSDGHSDYGRSFSEMWDRYQGAVTSRTTLIVTGDARNNYRGTGLAAFQGLAERSRATFWLNPEPRRFWDTGDSVMSVYAESCDSVDEVRTLRQLEAFVERVVLPSVRQRSFAHKPDTHVQVIS